MDGLGYFLIKLRVKRSLKHKEKSQSAVRDIGERERMHRGEQTLLCDLNKRRLTGRKALVE